MKSQLITIISIAIIIALSIVLIFIPEKVNTKDILAAPAISIEKY